MEIEKLYLEFDDKEINSFIKRINELYESQQKDLSTFCYMVYKLDCWFEDNPDCLLKSKTNDYYNKKQLFKNLGISNRLRQYYIQLYKKFMTLEKNDCEIDFAKIKEPFSCFSFTKLVLLLPIEYDKLVEYIQSGQLSSSMSVKDIKAFLKSLEEDFESDENEDEEGFDDDEFWLVLKNEIMCRDFLESFKSWQLWFYEERLILKYFRCRIGQKTLVAVLSFYNENGAQIEKVDYYYLEKMGLNTHSLSIEEITQDILSLKDKKVICPDCR